MCCYKVLMAKTGEENSCYHQEPILDRYILNTFQVLSLNLYNDPVRVLCNLFFFFLEILTLKD